MYDGKTGIFYWDEQTNDVQQLVAGGKSKEGIWTPFYNLSPDESKILVDTPVQIEDDFNPTSKDNHKYLGNIAVFKVNE